MRSSARKPRRKPCVLFLDDGFCAQAVAQPLIAAGHLVELFDTHFPDEERVRKQEVHDNLVIKLCSKKRWLIVTRDKEMRTDHVEFIKKCPHTMIVATANNSKGDLASWVNGLLLALPELKEKYLTFKRPWYSHWERTGRVSVCKTIRPAAYTRRTRELAKQ